MGSVDTGARTDSVREEMNFWSKISYMKKTVQVFMVVLFLLVSQVSEVSAQDAVVRIMLFYSPACGHCHRVISEDLPPLIDQYSSEPDILIIPPTEEEEPVGPPILAIMGDSIEILYVNTYTELGHDLYRALVEMLTIPPELQAVPTMIVGENLLIGGNEIPTKLPGIIEEGLASGGIDWIALPGLGEAIGQLVEVSLEPVPTEDASPDETQIIAPTEEQVGDTSTQTPSTVTQIENEPTASNVDTPSDIVFDTEFSVIERIKMDPLGNSISILVLVAMIVSAAIVGGKLIFPESNEQENSISWLIPLLSVIGIVIAAYLTYVEASGTEAVCGPVGDCNTVQQSKYALLFGIIPVGGIGLAGYVAIILAWVVGKYWRDPLAQWAKVALLGMSVFGTLFSIYLTFLEPFVIGATCAWCLTSAVIITILMWLSLNVGIDAFVRLRGVVE
jgi:uncharacterized membrane protein